MDILTKQEAFRLIGAIKGAPLVCLIILKINGLPLGVKRMAAISGYNEKTISKSFRTLEEYGLALQTQRFEGWQLTNNGRQLILFDFKDDHRFIKVRNETENLRLDDRETENFRLAPVEPPLSPDQERLITLLTHRCGCPPQKAAKAIAAALAAGRPPLRIELRILWWLAYCLSPEGHSIRAKGIYIAERVEQDIPCPDYFDYRDIPDRHDNLRQEIENLEQTLDNQEKITQKGEL